MKRRINWGIMGCASIAERTMIPAIKNSASGVVFGICSRNKKKAEEWQDRFNIVSAYPFYEAMLDDPAIDAVYIPLANHKHCEWAIKAAQAGKHVLVEKPFALNAAEAKKMADAADKNKVLMMEAFMYKFHPQNEKARKVVERKSLGKLQSLIASFTFMDQMNATNYRWKPEQGGGALYDVGCYTISAARFIFKEEPVSVYATARIHPKHKVDTSCSLLLEFPEGKTALLNCSFESQFQSYYYVTGTKGSMEVLRAFSQKMRQVNMLINNDNLDKTIEFPPTNQYTIMINHFDNCIRHKVPLEYPATDAINNMKVIDAAFQSIKTGKPVKL